MTLLDKLEKRFGRYAIANLPALIIACQVVVFVGSVLQQDGAFDLYQKLRLDPAKVYSGEIWRLVTFVLLAPLSQWPLFVIFFWYLFYLMGGALEQVWGAFKLNVYCFLSYALTLAATFIVYSVVPGLEIIVSDYLYGSIFLAFARLFPDFTLMIMFVLPVKVRWIALFIWVTFGITLVRAVSNGDWLTPIVVLASVGNYLIFFTRDILYDLKQGRRRQKWRAKTNKAAKQFEHKCHVCGLTSTESPKTVFRYCSKCAGQCCYCPEHLKDHQCVVAEDA